MAQDISYSDSPLFIREYKLIIGAAVTTNDIQNSTNSFTSTVDLDTKFSSQDKSTSTVKIIDDLQITFDIKKDTAKDPNKAVINVYNLSDDTLAYINNNIRNSLAVALMVGYRNNGLPVIFKGTVQWTQTTRQGADKVTELHCLDGGMNLSIANTSRSYPKGTKIKKIIGDLAGDLGCVTGNILVDDDSAISSASFFCGNTGHNLEALCKSINHTVSIQDGSVYVTPANMRRRATCFYVSETTGLIGSPEVYHDDLKPAKKVSKKTVNAKKKRPATGVTFQMLMQGAILPEKTVYLKSDDFDGYFKVSSVTHTGDYYGGEWITKVTASSVSEVASSTATSTTNSTTTSTTTTTTDED